MKTVVSQYIDQVFQACESIVEDARYRFYTSQTHGSNYELVRTSGEVAIKCILANYSRKEIEFHPNVQMTDQKILIPSRYISGETYLSGEMTVGGQIVTDAVTFDIIDIGKDTTGNIFYVQGRESTQ